MLTDAIRLLDEVGVAYRILREAYYHDMGRGEPPMNDLQMRIALFQSEVTRRRMLNIPLDD